MTEKNNTTCSICGNPYYVCMSCKDAMAVHPWKAFCDTTSHYQVFQVVKGYNTNVYTKDEAKDKLKNINLDDMDSFRPHIKQIVEDILKEENPIVKSVEKTEITVEAISEEITEVKNSTVVENIGEVEKTEDVIKTGYSRRRNFKAEE